MPPIFSLKVDDFLAPMVACVIKVLYYITITIPPFNHAKRKLHQTPGNMPTIAVKTLKTRAAHWTYGRRRVMKQPGLHKGLTEMMMVMMMMMMMLIWRIRLLPFTICPNQLLMISPNCVSVSGRTNAFVCVCSTCGVSGGLTFSPFNDERDDFRYLQLPTFPNQSTTNQHTKDQGLGFCWYWFDQIMSSFFVECPMGRISST